MEESRHNDTLLCHMADTPEDYRRLGLHPGSIGAWEDGLRTDTAPGSYEWALMSGGTSTPISTMDRRS
jgi:hypothetical protein